jgi:tRNA pseudouridine38-40 synthase
MTSPPVRWRLDVRYDGTDFAGWAVQADARTVQGELELWLGRVLRLIEPAQVVCAGRTDAGVHARGQVVHVDLPAACDLTEGGMLIRRLRRALPSDVVVTASRRAPAGFDARFGAIWRRYCYRIADHAAQRDPLVRSWVLDLDRSLDLDVINSAGRHLTGLRDFAAFCRSRPEATTIRMLLELRAERGRDRVVEFTVRADAFCHSMVRSLVGALVEVGAGRRDQEWLIGLTQATQRESSVPVLPARGLTLEEIGYPADAELADRVRTARSHRRLPDE